MYILCMLYLTMVLLLIVSDDAHDRARLEIYMYMYMYIHIYIYIDDDMLTPTGYSPPTQQPRWPTAHTPHSQHCGHTALPPGQ